MTPVSIVPLTGMPAIGRGCDLAAEIRAALARQGMVLADGDILVVAQKIVSKAEGRMRRLSDFTPSARALELAGQTGKDPRHVEAVLSESRAVVRTAPNVLITEHRLGHIMANAGIDHSNVCAGPDADDTVLLLPEDPDGSARALRAALAPSPGSRVGVIVSDSFGRPWRLGTTGVAIGVAGPAALIDKRGETDLFGRMLQMTEVAFADSVAAAAVLVMGEAAEGCPAAVIRGLAWDDGDQGAADVLRDAKMNLFR
jgi:coenzyme F420-0:L-glutamate ligase/coenzyme F420-1:gamma-L-glutamate ligase